MWDSAAPVRYTLHAVVSFLIKGTTLELGPQASLLGGVVGRAEKASKYVGLQPLHDAVRSRCTRVEARSKKDVVTA
jgi:hypothetical protein